jgi:hypothetical protein
VSISLDKWMITAWLPIAFDGFDNKLIDDFVAKLRDEGGFVTVLYIHIYVYIYMYLCMYVCIYIYMYLCMYIHIYIYIYLYIFIHIWV